MKSIILNVDKYDWDVFIIIDITCNDSDYVSAKLEDLGCPYVLNKDAYNLFNKCVPNIGLTYSNQLKRRTIIIIGRTFTVEEFINTTSHEVYHFIQQLKKSNYIDNEEYLAYLTGDLNKEIFKLYISK